MSIRRAIFFLIPSLILAVIIFLGFQFFFVRTSGKGALQVTATPDSTVFLNGKQIGNTPLCKCEGTNMLATGDYTLRLVPKDNNLLPYEEKITINKALLTVVDRKFGSQATSEGSVITLSPLNDKKKTEILVLSLPEGAHVFLDNDPVGDSPITLKDVTPSRHELKLSKDGYKEKSIPILTTAGYKLEATVYLAIDETAVLSPTPSPTPEEKGTPTPTPKKGTPTPTPKKGTPTPTKKAGTAGVKGTVVVLETPNGFLRVRESNSTTAAEVTRVDTGDELEFATLEDGWYQVKLKDGRTGWVSAEYVKEQ
jgi:uncharacterized protein YgiM (DUF1202 family)